MRRIAHKIIRLLYPPRCPLCGKILAGEGKRCGSCRKKLADIREPLCKKCGKPMTDERTEYCYDCSRNAHVYDRGRGLYLYKGDLKQSLYRFKYGNKREYAAFYGEELATHLGGFLRECQPDALIPIPLHRSKQRQRGFNQAELVAREVGRLCSIPVRTDVLLRTRRTAPQKKLNDQERKNNVKKAFKISQNIVKLKSVVLVDDIYTTGATMDEAAGVLKAAGVWRVFFISICIGRGC